jgi:hypothetical protein
MKNDRFQIIIPSFPSFIQLIINLHKPVLPLFPRGIDEKHDDSTNAKAELPQINKPSSKLFPWPRQHNNALPEVLRRELQVKKAENFNPSQTSQPFFFNEFKSNENPENRERFFSPQGKFRAFN